MARRVRPRADGSRIPWKIIDESLPRFVELREGDLPHRRGKNAPVEGTAPTYEEIAQAYNYEYGLNIKGPHIFSRIARHFRKPSPRKKKES